MAWRRHAPLCKSKQPRTAHHAELLPSRWTILAMEVEMRALPYQAPAADRSLARSLTPAPTPLPGTGSVTAAIYAATPSAGGLPLGQQLWNGTNSLVLPDDFQCAWHACCQAGLGLSSLFSAPALVQGPNVACPQCKPQGFRAWLRRGTTLLVIPFCSLRVRNCDGPVPL